MKKKKNIKKKKITGKRIKKLQAASKIKKKSGSVSHKKKKKKTSSAKVVKKLVKKPVKKIKSVSTSVKKAAKKKKTVLKTKSKKKTVSKKSQLKSSKVRLSKKVSSAAIKESVSINRTKKRKILELKKELEYLNKRDQKEVLPQNVEGISYCKYENCDQPAVTDGYCRYHYLVLWKYLQTKKQFSEDQYLFHTMQNIIKSLGEESLQFILRDLKNEKTFEAVAKEMNFSIKKEEETIIESDTGF